MHSDYFETICSFWMHKHKNCRLSNIKLSINIQNARIFQPFVSLYRNFNGSFSGVLLISLIQQPAHSPVKMINLSKRFQTDADEMKFLSLTLSLSLFHCTKWCMISSMHFMQHIFLVDLLTILNETISTRTHNPERMSVKWNSTPFHVFDRTNFPGDKFDRNFSLNSH